MGRQWREKRPMTVNNPAIILVNPQMGENIGAAARVMANFGLSDLRLVAPRDGWPNPAANTMSAGAFEWGVKAKVFDNLEDAIADLVFVLATTARPRGMEKPVTDANGGVVQLVAQGTNACGVMFGAEKTGLLNPHVALASAIMTYPVTPGFSSLNLAQAVGVFAHAWAARDEHSGVVEVESFGGVDAPASREELGRMFEHFENELERAGFFFPVEKTEMMKLNLRNGFTRSAWTQQEVQTFRGAVKALVLGRGKARIQRDDD